MAFGRKTSGQAGCFIGQRLHPAIAVKTARFRHRAASHRQTHFAILPSDTGPWPLPGCFAALRPSARANTKATTLAEELPQRCNAARARPTHRPRALRQRRGARCGKQKRVNPQLHHERFNRRLTRQTPQAFHSKEAVAPRRRFDGSTTYYTARGSTTVLSEKQRHDPDHGNSCGGERVVLRRR